MKGSAVRIRASASLLPLLWRVARRSGRSRRSDTECQEVTLADTFVGSGADQRKAQGLAQGRSRSSASWCADVGRELLVNRFEFGEPRLAVAAILSGDVCGEILDMDLESRSVGPE